MLSGLALLHSGTTIAAVALHMHACMQMVLDVLQDFPAVSAVD
jgi:hypothetical protein